MEIAHQSRAYSQITELQQKISLIYGNSTRIITPFITITTMPAIADFEMMHNLRNSLLFTGSIFIPANAPLLTTDNGISGYRVNISDCDSIMFYAEILKKNSSSSISAKKEGFNTVFLAVAKVPNYTPHCISHIDVSPSKEIMIDKVLLSCMILKDFKTSAGTTFIQEFYHGLSMKIPKPFS